jgi:hypothetical protein
MEGLMTEQPSVEALVERVRQAILRGSYDPQAGEWRAFFGPDTRDEAHAALDSLTAALEQLKRHDEAATQDAVFFRKGMVDAQEALERQRETTQKWYDEAHEKRTALERAERGQVALGEELVTWMKKANEAEARAQKAEAEVEKWIDLEHKMMERATEAEEKLEQAKAVVEAARGIIGSKESQSPWGQDVLNALARYDEPPTHPYYAERVAAGLPTSACPRCGVTDGYHAKDCSVDEPPTEQI